MRRILAMPLLCCWQVHYLLQPCADYVQAAVETVVDIHREDVPGDVLVFLTGDHTISLVGFWREGEGGGRHGCRTIGYQKHQLPS
jgi:hypothetical protein